MESTVSLSVTVHGFNMGKLLGWFSVSGHEVISRSLPDKFQKNQTRDNDWMLLDSSYSHGTRTLRFFRNRITGEQFILTLPFYNAEPIWQAFKGEDNTVLIVLASGNWKRGEKVYLGYIEVIG